MTGYVAAGLVGLALGLFGGGGSILTVPVFVYIMGIETVLATAYSLFVVGSTASVAAVGYARRRLVDYYAVLAFGLPSLCAVFLTRRFIIPAIPDTVISVATFTVTKGDLIMTVFAVVMLIAAVSMIRPQSQTDPDTASVASGRSVYLAAVEGSLVGFVTGLVGAGGGFLIVPMLVVRWKLSVRTAIGTSLLIIAVKSLIGFTGDLHLARVMDWPLLLGFSAIMCVGMFAGVQLNQRIEMGKLRTGFGWFVLIAAILIMFEELRH